MIEHPEAVTIAGQVGETLVGRRVRSAARGNTPHKWAFYSVRIGSGHTLVLGGGGERILYHASADTVPQKHQLLLHFDDGTFLTVKVQGWGSCQLFTADELEGYRWYAHRSLEPTDGGFTREYFESLFATLKPDDARSVRYFLISEPGVWGIGNGYLQDILLAARLHPRCRAVDLSKAQRRALHKAILQTIGRAVRLRGRTDEYDLFGQTGRYERLLSASVAGLPCPACGQAAIAKESFLGGTIYTCPQCQPAPPKPDRRAAKKKP